MEYLMTYEQLSNSIIDDFSKADNENSADIISDIISKEGEIVDTGLIDVDDHELNDEIYEPIRKYNSMDIPSIYVYT